MFKIHFQFLCFIFATNCKAFSRVFNTDVIEFYFFFAFFNKLILKITKGVVAALAWLAI